MINPQLTGDPLGKLTEREEAGPAVATCSQTALFDQGVARLALSFDAAAGFEQDRAGPGAGLDIQPLGGRLDLPLFIGRQGEPYAVAVPIFGRLGWSSSFHVEISDPSKTGSSRAWIHSDDDLAERKLCRVEKISPLQGTMPTVRSQTSRAERCDLFWHRNRPRAATFRVLNGINNSGTK
jgi:hypothetical protein